MKENPPIRHTIDIEKETKKLPQIPDTSTLNIPTNEYVVISEASTHSKIRKIQYEINSKQDYIDNLEQKIAKLQEEIYGKKSDKQRELLENIKKMNSKIERLSNEYTRTKNNLLKKYDNYAMQASKLQVQKNNLNGYKIYLRVLKWVLNKSKLASFLSEIKELILLFREQSLYPFISAISQSIRDTLLVKPEIERICHNSNSDFENRSKDIEQLKDDVKEIKSVLKLKKETYLTLKIKSE